MFASQLNENASAYVFLIVVSIFLHQEQYEQTEDSNTIITWHKRYIILVASYCRFISLPILCLIKINNNQFIS